MGEPEPSLLASHLLRGVRVASTVITVSIILGLALPNVVANLGSYRPAWLVLAGLGVLLGVAVIDGALVASRRSWGWSRWPVAVLVLVVSAVATSAVPDELLVTPADPMLGVVGWLGVLLFAERSVGLLGVFIACHLVVIFVLVGVADRLDQPTTARMLLAVVSIAGFQLAVGAAAQALRRVAAQASSVAARRDEIRTAEAVARQLHHDRNGRYEALRSSVVPLLRGMAEGSLQPAEPAVQRRCAVEATRMRRLFAEDDDVDDHLVNELSAVVNVAERRGVMVTQSTRGRWMQPPRSVRGVLVDEVAAALLSADGAARLTIGGTESTVVVSVVVTGSDIERGVRDRGGVRVITLGEGEQVWMEARWSTVPAS